MLDDVLVSMKGFSDNEVWRVFWLGRWPEDRDAARLELWRRGINHRALEWGTRANAYAANGRRGYSEGARG